MYVMKMKMKTFGSAHAARSTASRSTWTRKIEVLWNGQGLELRPEGFARVGHSSGEGRVAARVASLHPPTPAMLLFTFPVWTGLSTFRTSNRSNESQPEAPRTRRRQLPQCPIYCMKFFSLFVVGYASNPLNIDDPSAAVG